MSTVKVFFCRWPVSGNLVRTKSGHRLDCAEYANWLPTVRTSDSGFVSIRKHAKVEVESRAILRVKVDGIAADEGVQQPHFRQQRAQQLNGCRVRDVALAHKAPLGTVLRNMGRCSLRSAQIRFLRARPRFAEPPLAQIGVALRVELRQPPEVVPVALGNGASELGHRHRV